MQSRPLGSSGMDASVIGFGAWAIGGWMWGGAEEADAIDAIHAAIDAGITLIDTAPVYGFGRSEEIVGKALRDRRKEVVLATKCGLIWHSDMGEYYFASELDGIKGKDGSIRVYRCLRPEVIRYEVEESLRRLGTDVIDVYQTHWQESTTPIADTMGELMRLKDEGKIRAIGCSNATPEQMDEYRAAGELSVDQEKYSMLDRQQEETNLPYCVTNNVAFFAYSPIAQGLLTGKINPDRKYNDGDQRVAKPRFHPENLAKVKAMLEEFQPVAAEHNMTLTQLAIAWTVAQPGCSHALVGARSPEQVTENAGAGRIVLSEQDQSLMRKAIEEHSSDIP